MISTHTLQEHKLRQMKARLGALPIYLPAIEHRSASSLPTFPIHQAAQFKYSSSPLSGSRSSSFSNNSWTSAQDESPFYTASSCNSSNGSFYTQSSTTCSPGNDYYSPHRPSLNSIKETFTPPTATLEQLLNRSSHNDILRNDTAFNREIHAFRSTCPVTPSPPSTAINLNSASKAAIKTEKYKTELCRSWEEQGQCRYGLKCLYSHGLKELRDVSRHPKYKTELCHSFYNTGSCPYAKRCVFVHSTVPLEVESPIERDNASKAPLLSRVGVRSGTAVPKLSEQADVDVQYHRRTEEPPIHFNQDTNLGMSAVEKWGLEMASFPSQWLTSSLADYTVKATHSMSLGARSLRPGMQPPMV